MKKILSAIILAFLSTSTFAMPTIDGNVVTFPNDGNRWKVYSRDTATNICLSWRDGLECVVPIDGEYFIINVTTNMRMRVDILADTTTGPGPMVDSSSCPSLARHYIDQVSFLGRVATDSIEGDTYCISTYGNAENLGVVNIGLNMNVGSDRLNSYDMRVLRSLSLPADIGGTEEKSESLVLSPEEANACAVYSGCTSSATSVTPPNPELIFPGGF